MIRWVYTNSMVLSLILLQIYIMGRSFGVCSSIMGDSKNLIKRNIYVNTVGSVSCCRYGECDILCCVRKGNCPDAKKIKLVTMVDGLETNSTYQNQSVNTNAMKKTLKNRQKRTAQSFISNEMLCYDSNNNNNLRLWDNSAPGAVGDDPCRDIPFLKVFLPTGSIRRTDVGIIIIPGGGYDKLTNVREQAPVAEYFANKLGITSFVLYYRLVQNNGIYRYPVPMWDAQRALRYVRYNAAWFNISPHRVGIFGFSAGGHLASTIALHSDYNFDLQNQDNLDQTNARPDFLGLGYPVISMDPQQYASQSSLKHLLYGYTGSELRSLENFLSGQKHVNPYTPPTFLFESIDDQQISAQNSVLFVNALQNAGIPHKAQIFEHGKHGVGLAQHQSAEHIWPKLFYNWLIERRIISNF